MLPLATQSEVYCDELLPDSKVETEREQGPGLLRDWIDQLICGGDTSIISQETATRHEQLNCLSTL